MCGCIVLCAFLIVLWPLGIVDSRNYFVHTTGQGVGSPAFDTQSHPVPVDWSQAGGRPVDLLEELANVVQNHKNGHLLENRTCQKLAKLKGKLCRKPSLFWPRTSY